MDSQTIKTRSKRRTIGSKDGLDRGINDPNLSGKYIRSLVRQLSSSKSLANPADLKTEVPKSASTESAMNVAGNGTYGSSNNLEKPQDSNGTHNPEVSSCTSSVYAPDHQQQQKKQIRRRPHTRKKSQDCPLNIAQARKEIVTALNLHRAAASKLHAARSQTESQKPRNNANVSSSHNTNLHNHDSAGMSSNGSTRCNSCLPIKGGAALYKEAKAITICGHLLCWTCLSEFFLDLSAWVVKICPVCANPLTTNHIFPIAAGVPVLIEQTDACTTSILLQSSPLLINPLPLPQPQPAWSTTGPSLGTSMDEIISSGIDISQDFNINYISVSPNVLQQSLTAMDNATAEAFSVASQSPESCIGAVDPENGHSIRGNCRHVAMDEDELAEIRSLAEQHETEWSDSVNLTTSTWWFNFFKTSEFNSDMDILYQTGFDSSGLYSSLENVLKQEEMGFYPVQLEDPLSNINEGFYISSDQLPVESLWPDEWYDYEQDNCKEVLEIELNENHLEATSEVFTHNKSACDQDLYNIDKSDVHSDLGSENLQNTAEKSVGDKRKRDCTNNWLKF